MNSGLFAWLNGSFTTGWSPKFPELYSSIVYKYIELYFYIHVLNHPNYWLIFRYWLYHGHHLTELFHLTDELWIMMQFAYRLLKKYKIESNDICWINIRPVHLKSDSKPCMIEKEK